MKRMIKAGYYADWRREKYDVDELSAFYRKVANEIRQNPKAVAVKLDEDSGTVTVVLRNGQTVDYDIDPRSTTAQNVNEVFGEPAWRETSYAVRSATIVNKDDLNKLSVQELYDCYVTDPDVEKQLDKIFNKYTNDEYELVGKVFPRMSKEDQKFVKDFMIKHAKHM